MHIERERWVAIVVVVVSILVGFAGYWYYLVPPLEVSSNGLFDSLQDMAMQRFSALPDKFLVVVVKANHWPGPLVSKDFELEYSAGERSVKAKCVAMEMLPEKTSKAGSTGFWLFAGESGSVSLEQKRKYSHIVFAASPDITAATLIYRGQPVGNFTVNRNPFDEDE